MISNDKTVCQRGLIIFQILRHYDLLDLFAGVFDFDLTCLLLVFDVKQHTVAHLVNSLRNIICIVAIIVVAIINVVVVFTFRC